MLWSTARAVLHKYYFLRAHELSCRIMTHNTDPCGEGPLQYGSRPPAEADPHMSFVVWLSQLSWPRWLRVTVLVALAKQRRTGG